MAVSRADLGALGLDNQRIVSIDAGACAAIDGYHANNSCRGAQRSFLQQRRLLRRISNLHSLHPRKGRQYMRAVAVLR